MILVLYVIAANLLAITCIAAATYLQATGREGFWAMIILAWLSARLPYGQTTFNNQPNKDEKSN